MDFYPCDIEEQNLTALMTAHQKIVQMKSLNSINISLLTEDEKGQLKGGFKKVQTLSTNTELLANINCYGSSPTRGVEEPVNTNCHYACKCSA